MNLLYFFRSQIAIFTATVVITLFYFPNVTGQESVKPFFDGAGDPASQETMSKAAANIEKYRKGDFNLMLVDSKGKPINAKVAIELTNHKFHFGTSMLGISSGVNLTSELQELAKKAITDIFNTVHVCDYWHNYRPDTESYVYKNDRPEEDLKFAAKHNLFPRYHAILYNYPRWIMGRGYTSEQCWQMIEGRIKYVADNYRDRITEFDVFNEHVSAFGWPDFKQFYDESPGFPQFRDPQEAKRVMNLTRKYLPDAKLVILEAQLPSVYNPKFMATVDCWREMVKAGVDFDYVGHQAHFSSMGGDYRNGSKYYPNGGDTYTMAGIEKALDELGSIGKPVIITEFNGPTRAEISEKENAAWTLSDEENAAWQINFYRLVFSKPYIEQLTRWYLIDGFGGRRGIDAGVLYKNGEKHAVYDKLRDLIKKEWHTAIQQTPQNGRLAFRGFFGTYSVKVNGYKLAIVILDKTGEAKIILEKK